MLEEMKEDIGKVIDKNIENNFTFEKNAFKNNQYCLADGIWNILDKYNNQDTNNDELNKIMLKSNNELNICDIQFLKGYVLSQQIKNNESNVLNNNQPDFERAWEELLKEVNLSINETDPFIYKECIYNIIKKYNLGGTK